MLWQEGNTEGQRSAAKLGGWVGRGRGQGWGGEDPPPSAGLTMWVGLVYAMVWVGPAWQQQHATPSGVVS